MFMSTYRRMFRKMLEKFVAVMSLGSDVAVGLLQVNVKDARRSIGELPGEALDTSEVERKRPRAAPLILSLELVSFG